MGVLCDSQLEMLCEKKSSLDPVDAAQINLCVEALAEILATLEACIALMPHLAAMHAAVLPAGKAGPCLSCRCAADIDAELMLCVSVYHAAAHLPVGRQGIGRLSEQSLLLLFVRIAALAWVLHPELSEVGAQGFAWELIAAYADEAKSGPTEAKP